MTRNQIANETGRINRGYEKLFFPKVRKAIDAKKSSLIGILKREGIQAAKRRLANDLSNERLAKVVENLYQVVGMRHANRQYADLRQQQRGARKSAYTGMELKRFGFNEEWVKFIINYLRLYLLEKITFKVNETTREKLMDVLEDAVREGLGIDEIVKTLEDLPFTRFQAARIVRTEINRAANVGVLAAANSFEYEQNKEWISVGDIRTRGRNPEDHADHFRMNGMQVDENDFFIDPRNGKKIRFPGDPEADPEMTINCRCILAMVARRDERGRLIPKVRTAPIRGLERVMA